MIIDYMVELVEGYMEVVFCRLGSLVVFMVFVNWFFVGIY